MRYCTNGKSLWRRCYDVLDQRQGRRDAGVDPEGATARSAEVVEHYEQ